MSMKIGVVALVLWASLSQAQTTASTKTGEQSQQLTIKNPAEYDAYMKAIQMPNTIEKAQALDRFLSRYPKAVAKAEVLKAELFVYQQVKNEDEVVRTAERLLESEPANLRMLALLASAYRECAGRNGMNAKTCVDSAVKYGHRGLDVIEKVRTPPVGMTPEEYDTLKAQVRPIFQDAVRLEQPRGTSTHEQSSHW